MGAACRYSPNARKLFTAKQLSTKTTMLLVEKYLRGGVAHKTQQSINTFDNLIRTRERTFFSKK